MNLNLCAKTRIGSDWLKVMYNKLTMLVMLSLVVSMVLTSVYQTGKEWKFI